MSTTRNLFRTSADMFVARNVGRRRALHDRGKGVDGHCMCSTYVAWSAPYTGCDSRRNGSGLGRAVESRFVLRNHRRCTSVQSRQAYLLLSSDRPCGCQGLGRPSSRHAGDSAPPLRVVVVLALMQDASRWRSGKKTRLLRLTPLPIRYDRSLPVRVGVES